MSFTRVVGPGIHSLSNIDSHNIHSSGIITATKFDGPFDSLTVSGNLSIGGTLTYEDVTNIDSVGIITARAGVNVTGGQISGNGGGLTGIVAAALGGGSQENARARGITAVVSAASKAPLVGGNAPAVLSATAGVAVNNHMALVYRGPNSFRTHTFNFSFFPKNQEESDTVQIIIRDLPVLI